MNNNKILKQEIIENAEMLFIKVGFLKFEIFELSKKLNIDVEMIRTYFISKGGLLLSILSELYVEVFGLNNSFVNSHLSIQNKKEVFSKVMMVHERKIVLIVSLIEKKEVHCLDFYLLKLLSRTITLHYRLFLLQYKFDDSVDAKSRRAKYHYYQLFDRFKTTKTVAFYESC